MNDTRWWKYLQKLMGDQTQLEAARFIGISKSNITRWKDGARAAPDFVVKVARAYKANVLEALVEAEFITEEEAQLHEIKVGGVTLTDATNEQILAEIMRRSDPEARYLFGADGDSAVVDLDDAADAAVFDIRPPHVEGLPYAADDSDTEPEEGDDDYHDGP
ncbi:helix-turn-helix domain-containing protein [Corynebacterium striatum]|uniref:helix-turn-helix domain-containing protein n=1 Tax=Corynebacterium striatum TaxID=43770 RepID=UPI003B5944AD